MEQKRPPLSQRELQVLGLMAEGLSDKEIAAQLGITPGTVSNHIFKIYLKLGAARRTHAVAIASRLGLLSDAHVVRHIENYRIDEARRPRT